MKKLIILLIIFIISYSSYVSFFRDELNKIEGNNKILYYINNFLRTKFDYLSGRINKTNTNIGDYYNKNIGPKVDNLKVDVFSGVTNIKTGVDEKLSDTKNKIDGIRTTLSGAESTINKIEDVYKKGQETLSGAKGVVDDMDKMRNGIMNIVNTGSIN